MHGSLLRSTAAGAGNWAILHGETETGATLHEMVEKPDAGRIVDQEAVAILPDERAVTCSEKSRGRLARSRAQPAEARRRQRGPSRAGSFQGRLFRRPPAEDGRIDWSASAKRCTIWFARSHRPTPGVHRSGRDAAAGAADAKGREQGAARAPRSSTRKAAAATAACADGEVLELLEVELDGRPLSAQEFAIASAISGSRCTRSHGEKILILA